MSRWYDSLPDERRTAILARLNRSGAEFLKEAHGDREYACWLLVCDVIIHKSIGLGLFDLSDQTWLDYYKDELNPGDAVDLALEEECE